MKTLDTLLNYYKDYLRIDSNNAWNIICKFKEIFCKHIGDHENELWEIMKDFHEQICGKHFIEPYAVYQVSKMYHTNNKGINIETPMFSIDCAKKVYDKYVKQLNKDYTVWDVYVALNAQYHDNINLYEKWFPNLSDDEIESKIIQATIANWFEDEDARCDKVWNYFRAV